MTASSVFSKRRVDPGTRLLIESMVLPKTGCILDIGCGYGAVGIVAAALNPKLNVVMSDVNTRAVRLAKKNVEFNKITNAQVRYSFFVVDHEEVSVLIVCSQTRLSGAEMDTVKAIVKETPKVMASKATFQMVIRSKIQHRKPCHASSRKPSGTARFLQEKAGSACSSAARKSTVYKAPVSGEIRFYCDSAIWMAFLMGAIWLVGFCWDKLFFLLAVSIGVFWHKSV